MTKTPSKEKRGEKAEKILKIILFSSLNGKALKRFLALAGRVKKGGTTEALLSGEAVKLAEFGMFSVRKRADRLGRNSTTGEFLLIKIHRLAVFRPTRCFWGEGTDRDKQN
ncbi:MAG: HU family DNA-binding protein [Leptospirales bacterium]